jgi:hypothetical protein
MDLWEVVVDLVFIGAMVAFLLVTWAFAHGCEKLSEPLGERQ